MANRARGEVTVVIGGREYVLAPTVKAILEAEEKSGFGIAGMMDQFSKGNIGLKSVAALVYGGMIGSGEIGPTGRKLTYLDVAQMIQKEGVHKLIGPCSNFLVECVTGEEKPPEEPAAGEPQPRSEVPDSL